MILSIIIVSFNDQALLERCLSSLYQHMSFQDTQIFVVDNASRDDSANMVRSKFPQVHLMTNDANHGFPSANNQALELCDGEFVLLLNQDTEICDNTLQTLLRIMQSDPTIGILGPRLNFPNGTPQISFGDFLNLTGYLKTILFPDALLTKMNNKRTLDIWAQQVPVEVDWVTGACFMIRRNVIEDVGKMDGNYFLFGEEIDWCYRTRQAGYRVCIYPQVAIIHIGGSTATRQMDKRLFDTHASKLYFAKKFYGKSVFIYNFFMLAECAYKIILYGLAWLLLRGRSYRQHIVGYFNFARYLLFEKKTTPYIDSGKYGWRSGI